MGMFDSVICRCPKCGGELEFQSKAGECVLDRFGIGNVPANVAQDIEVDIESCKTCHARYRIYPRQPVATVQMMLVEE